MSSWSNILLLMERHHLSKRRLAELCNVQPSAVTKWARGGEIGAEKLNKIALHCGVTVDWILNDTFGGKENGTGGPVLKKVANHSVAELSTPLKKNKIIALQKSLTHMKAELAKMEEAIAQLSASDGPE